MYMMMTRRPPFRGESEQEVMESILSKEPFFDKNIYSKYSLESIDFMKSLLIKNPNHRI